MNTPLPSLSAGSGMGRAHQYNLLLLDLAIAAWGASTSAFRWVMRHSRRHGGESCRGGVPRATPAAPLRPGPSIRHYAPSTVRRYGQITRRFVAWQSRHLAKTPGSPGFACFLSEIAATASTGCGGRRGYSRCDPRHLALLRTSICAVRATIDKPMGLGLTTGVRLPPRGAPVPAASPAIVAALRAAVRDPRERLLVILACDLGLRPGQMVKLRWRDIAVAQGLVHTGGIRGQLDVAIPTACHGGLVACAHGHTPDDFLFAPPLCNAAARALTVRSLQNALGRLVRRSGVGSGITFTCLRKACAAQGRPMPQRQVHRMHHTAGTGQALALRTAGRLNPSATSGLSLPSLASVVPAMVTGEDGDASVVARRVVPDGLPATQVPCPVWDRSGPLAAGPAPHSVPNTLVRWGGPATVLHTRRREPPP